MLKSWILRAATMVALASMAMLGTDHRDALAQNQGDEWSEPTVLTTLGARPTIVADSMGDLHLFFLDVLERSEGDRSGAIYYMSRTGGQWAPPLDVVASSDPSVELNGAAVNEAGYLHLAWRDSANAFHSRAHISQAGNAQNWETTSIVPGRYPNGEMVLDENGRLHMALVTDFASVVYLYSEDGGDNWSPPLPVDRVVDTENLAIGGVQMAVDQGGVLHLTWFQTALEVNWNSWSVWYGRSSDGGNSWQISEMAEPLFGESDVAVDGDNNVHLVYGRNIGYGDGRWHQWSSDGGESWSNPQPLYPGVEHASGSTGGYGFALDGDGRLHLVNSYGRRDGEASAWHLVWLGDHWSTPEVLLDVQYHAHQSRLAISGGNELNFVALAPRQQYSLIYREQVIDSQATDRQEVATRPIESAGSTFGEDEELTAAPTPAVTRIGLSPEAMTAPPSEAPFNSLIVAVGASALFLLVVVLLVRRLTVRRR